jgi:hypothetical protein
MNITMFLYAAVLVTFRALSNCTLAGSPVTCGKSDRCWWVANVDRGHAMLLHPVTEPKLRGKVKNYPHFCFSNLFTQK